MLINRLEPAPRLSMSGVIPLLPLHAFMVWTANIFFSIMAPFEAKWSESLTSLNYTWKFISFWYADTYYKLRASCRPQFNLYNNNRPIVYKS